MISYNPTTGTFTKNGERTGSVGSHGYLVVSCGGEVWLAHRLAFSLMGFKPPEFVDHKDGDPLNNKWSNLRSSTRTRNNRNKKIYSRNRSGVTGVNFEKGKWVVRVGREYHGRFADKDEAIKVRQAIASQKGYSTRHGT